MNEGRFVLHRFNGDEVYRLASAMIRAYASAGGVTVWFEARADRDAIRRCEDTVELEMAPNAKVAVEVPELDADQLVGRTFVIPGTATDKEDSCKALLYYCGHEPLRSNSITIVSRSEDRFVVRWTAVTKDVNYYDGSKPATLVEIEDEFWFKDIEKWTRT